MGTSKRSQKAVKVPIVRNSEFVLFAFSVPKTNRTSQARNRTRLHKPKARWLCHTPRRENSPRPLHHPSSSQTLLRVLSSSQTNCVHWAYMLPRLSVRHL